MQLHAPLLSRKLILPKAEVRDIPDYDKKLQAIAETYLDHDIRALTGTTCWFSILFDRVLAAAKARDGRRVHTVSEICGPTCARCSAAASTPSPTGRSSTSSRWAVADPDHPYLQSDRGRHFSRSPTSSRRRPRMLILPDRGVFFEFIPREEHGRPKLRPRRYSLWCR